MARVAILVCLLEVLCHVALAAGRRYVQPEKGIGREVVVESHLGPLRRGVASLAILAHGTAMRVGGAMAARAVGAEFLFLEGCGVTSLAGYLGVRSRELEIRVLEGGNPPQIVAMTGATGEA